MTNCFTIDSTNFCFNENDFDDDLSSSIQTISSKTHLDHVYSYSGQNYGDRESIVLHALNELSRRNQLIVSRRQIANRNVRILLPSLSQSQFTDSPLDNKRSSLSNNNNNHYENQIYSKNKSKSTIINNNTNEKYFSSYLEASSLEMNDDPDDGFNDDIDNDIENHHENFIRHEMKHLFLSNDKNNNNDTSSKNQNEAFYTNKKTFNRFSNINSDLNFKIANDNQNYQTFLYHFNKIAMACYLKLMRVSKPFWSAYSIDEQIGNDTNFYVLKSNNNDSFNKMQQQQDMEFLSNYLEIMAKMHKKVVSKLYKTLNTQTIRFHFNHATNNRQSKSNELDFSSEDFEEDVDGSSENNNNNNNNNNSSEKKSSTKSNDCHLFRSFRIIGLRQVRNRLNRNGSSKSFRLNQRSSDSSAKSQKINNFLSNNQFHEIVDIRSSFDIKQFQNRSGYDCFIECEMNYFKVANNQPHEVAQSCSSQQKVYFKNEKTIRHKHHEEPLQQSDPAPCHHHHYYQNYKYFKKKSSNSLKKLNSNKDKHYRNIIMSGGVGARNQKFSDLLSSSSSNSSSSGSSDDDNCGDDLLYKNSANSSRDHISVGSSSFSSSSVSSTSSLFNNNDTNWVDCLNRNLINKNNLAFKYTDNDLKNMAIRNKRINDYQNFHHHYHHHQQQQQQHHHNNPNHNQNSRVEQNPMMRTHKQKLNFIVT